jgi:tetratricopeptide (TPR) repeat protein
MLGSCIRTIAVLMLLLPQAARSLDLGNQPHGDANQLSAQGDSLFRQSRFKEAEAAYSEALDLDPRSVRGHLGMGKIAALLSDRGRAAKHYSVAYQVEPSNPDAILAFADVVMEREARQTLLRNFLELSPADDKRREDVRARLRVEEQLGTRKVAELKSAYQPYQIPLNNLRAGGLVLHARINGGSDLKLILDTGATGVTLNASAGRNAGLEILAPAALVGFGSAAPTRASIALAASFETGAALKITNLLVEVSETELTPDADGMIGLDVFQDFLIRVDPHARQLELSPFDERDTSLTCVNCTQAYRLGHLLLVPAEVNGHGEGYFILDTGSPYTLISQMLMPRSGRATTMAGAEGDQALAVPSTPVALRLGALHMWGFQYATLDTDKISSSNGTAIAGAIGYSLVRDLSLTVNYRAGLVKLGTLGHE